MRAVLHMLRRIRAGRLPALLLLLVPQTAQANLTRDVNTCLVAHTQMKVCVIAFEVLGWTAAQHQVRASFTAHARAQGEILKPRRTLEDAFDGKAAVAHVRGRAHGYEENNVIALGGALLTKHDASLIAQLDGPSTDHKLRCVLVAQEMPLPRAWLTKSSNAGELSAVQMVSSDRLTAPHVFAALTGVQLVRVSGALPCLDTESLLVELSLKRANGAHP